MSGACNCHKKVMDRLREIYPNTHISGQYEASGRAYMSYRVEYSGDKKKKVVPLLCSHCPHCGKAYPPHPLEAK